MSEADRNRAILRARAAKLRERGMDVQARRLHARVVVVEAGREAYGLPVEHLREIVPASPITALPNMPAFLLGLAGVRGELVSVIDLAELHGRGQTGASSYFAVLEAAGRLVALRIETVVGFRDVYEDEVVAGLTRTDESGEETHRTTRDHLSLVDVGPLLAGSRLRVAGARGGAGGTT